MLIPKIIHYCWLSNDKIPEVYQAYINLWKIKLPDYQFILWDTKRFDINSTIWTQQAFKVQMYACAADYIRLYAVYHYGGIYLDTDMEVIKSFDPLLDAEIILGRENHISENIEAGCFGAVKGHPYIQKCMEYFEKTKFFNPLETEKIMNMPVSERHEYIDPLIVPAIMKNVLKQYFSDRGLKIYPRTYFTAKNVLTGVIEKSEDTFTIHHFGSMYHSEEWRKERENIQNLHLIFGNGIVFKLVELIICRRRALIKRIRRDGFKTAMNYYIDKYIKKKNGSKKNYA